MPRKKTNLTMPVLALRGLMVFPHMVLHFDVGRPKSVAALQEAMMNDQKIFLVAQKDVDDPDPTPENLCTVGTIANIRQVMNLPGDSLRVLVEGETRGELTAVTQEDPFLLGRIHLPKVTEPEDEMELAALVRTAKDYFDAYARASQRVSQETIASIRDVDDAEQIADLIAANILTKLEDRQQILEEFDIQRRLERLCTILSREIELTGVEKQVQERVKKQIDKNQKDYYLREHMTLPFERNIKCSNYVGETIDMAVDMGVKGILFVAHIGKFVKVAAGIMNTHSHSADARMEVLAANALRVGADGDTARDILNCNTTDEALDILHEKGLLEPAMKEIMEKIQFYLDHRSYEQIKLGAVVFNNVYGYLGKTRDAGELIQEIQKQDKMLKLQM